MRLRWLRALNRHSGLPGSSDAAGSGLVAAQDVYESIRSATAFDTYRGVMIWDTYWDTVRIIHMPELNNSDRRHRDGVQDASSTCVSTRVRGAWATRTADGYIAILDARVGLRAKGPDLMQLFRSPSLRLRFVSAALGWPSALL